jgi:Glycosyl transferase family 2
MDSQNSIESLLQNHCPQLSLASIFAVEAHRTPSLGGWVGLYSCLGRTTSGSIYEIDLRFAWSSAIWQQQLWDLGWSETSLLDNAKTDRHKLIIYLCDPAILGPKGEISPDPVPLEPEFGIGCRWQTVTHIYSSQPHPFPIPRAIHPSPTYPTKLNLVTEAPPARQQNLATHLFQTTGTDQLQTGGLRTRGLFKTAPPELPLLSIVTVVYNGAKYLEQTIQSVIHQSYPHLEYIIVDGGSTDGTLEIIRRYADHINYWISDADSGIYCAMNKGTRLAQGSHVLHLNADDLLFGPEALAWLGQADPHKSHMNAILKVDIQNNRVIKDSIGPANGSLLDNAYYRNYFFALSRVSMTHPGFVGLVNENSLFPEQHRIMSDTIMLARKFETEPVEISARVLSIFRSGGISANNGQILAEMFQEIAAAPGFWQKILVWLKLQGIFFLPRRADWK